MIELVKLEKRDIDEFTEIAIQSFEEDKIMYGDYPPLIDIENHALRFIHQGDTYKILKEGKLIGGTVIFNDRNGHYTLGAIFIHPSYQNQGFGQQVMQLIEEKYSDAKSWFLDTPYLSVRNHHFYEKMGYIKTGEEIPDKESDFKLFLYKKVMI
jgi:GNAT superfamily N-acetyltransferase